MSNQMTEIEKVAAGYVNWGANLAMQKVAAEEEDMKKEEEEEEEDKRTPPLNESEKKEAAAAGALIARGFIGKIAEAGIAHHGSADFYFRKMALDAGCYKAAAVTPNVAYRGARNLVNSPTLGRVVGGGALGLGVGAATGAAVSPENRARGAVLGGVMGAGLGGGAGYALGTNAVRDAVDSGAMNNALSRAERQGASPSGLAKNSPGTSEFAEAGMTAPEHLKKNVTKKLTKDEYLKRKAFVEANGAEALL